MKIYSINYIACHVRCEKKVYMKVYPNARLVTLYICLSLSNLNLRFSRSAQTTKYQANSKTVVHFMISSKQKKVP